MMLLEELSSDELDDDFAFFVGFATAEAFVISPATVGATCLPKTL